MAITRQVTPIAKEIPSGEIRVNKIHEAPSKKTNFEISNEIPARTRPLLANGVITHRIPYANNKKFTPMKAAPRRRPKGSTISSGARIINKVRTKSPCQASTLRTGSPFASQLTSSLAKNDVITGPCGKTRPRLPQAPLSEPTRVWYRNIDLGNNPRTARRPQLSEIQGRWPCTWLLSGGLGPGSTLGFGPPLPLPLRDTTSTTPEDRSTVCLPFRPFAKYFNRLGDLLVCVRH